MPEAPGPPAARRAARPVSRRALLIGVLLALALNLAGLLPALRSPRLLDGGDILLSLVTLASSLVLLVFVETGRRSPPRPR